jgi:arsenate reductase
MAAPFSIQLIGTRKDPDTRKAERFFRDRGVTIHFVDVTERALSPGELRNIAARVGPERLLDRESREFERAGLAHMVYDPLEEIQRRPGLLKVPVVRWGREVTVGLQPQTWKSWLRARNP